MNGKCILFVVSEELGQRKDQLSDAQVEALKYKLPLAVVFLHRNDLKSSDNKKLIKELKKTESILNMLSISFILLLGVPAQSLSAITYHTKPAAIFHGSLPAETSKLTHHPYAWPGVVQPIDDLVVN